MERILWLIIIVPIAILFTGLGVYAWRRDQPMWFWSGQPVKAREISDIPAYNRANGIMWIGFSSVYWLGALLGWFRIGLAGIVVGAGTLAGIPVLVLVYQRIYRKYKRL